MTHQVVSPQISPYLRPANAPGSDGDDDLDSEDAREMQRLDEVRRKAAKKLGLEADQAQNLYLGGLSSDAFDDQGARVAEVKKERQRERLRFVTEIKKEPEVRVKPTAIEFSIQLKHTYEPLGCVFAQDSMLVERVLPGGAACRAGVLPVGTVLSVDEVRVRSPASLLETIRMLRLAKRLEYTIEVHYETPPLDLLGAAARYTAHSIASMPRPPPQWRYRDEVPVYSPPPKGAEPSAEQMLEAITADAAKAVEKQKRLVRVPQGLMGRDLDRLTLPEARQWQLLKEEEECRQDILRWSRGRLVALKAAAPEDIAFMVERAYLDAMSADLQVEDGWGYRKVWAAQVQPWMTEPTRDATASRKIPPKYSSQAFVLDPSVPDWVNPRARNEALQPPVYSPRADIQVSPRSGGRGAFPGPHGAGGSAGGAPGSSVPRWAVEAVRTAVVFAAGATGFLTDYPGLKQATEPCGPVAVSRPPVCNRDRAGVKTPSSWR